MPTFPLPTLAFQVTATGISAPSFSDILSSLTASFQSIFGSDAYLQPDSQEGQWIAVLAAGINDQNQAAIALYNSMSPATAQGTGLSSLVKINGLLRHLPTNSSVTVTIVGVVGTEIDNGVVMDTNSNLWNLPSVVIIPLAGSIDVLATAQQAGAIAATANSVNVIQTPTLGWQTANNANPATPGAPVETDAALRKRQSISTSLSALTPLQAIVGSVANIAGVQRSAIYENPTNAPDTNGLPAHSISVVAEGGDLTAVATAIEQKKSPGTATFGSTTIVVNDPAGVPVSINFYQLAIVNVWVSVTIKALPGYTAALNSQITGALLSFINSLPIGDSVYFNWLIGIAGLDANIAFRITSLTLGTAPAPAGTADVAIAFNQAAKTVAANIILTVT